MPQCHAVAAARKYAVAVVANEKLICFTAMIKIAGTKSNDKINFKEFVDFFYKAD